MIEVLSSDELDLEAAERKRAQQREQLEAEIRRAEKQAVERGVRREGPPAVVQAERDKLERLRSEREAL